MPAKYKARDIILCAQFAALIAVGAFIRIPVPVVPFTLQLLFSTLSGLLLGPRWGAFSVLIYISLGLMGVPVFTEGGGLAYIFKPTFGYLIGFSAGAYVTGAIVHAVPSSSLRRILGANFAGLGIVYFSGLAYYYLISHLYSGTAVGLWPLFLYGFVLAVPGDILLCVLAAFAAKRIIPVLNI